jgi:octaprenyl-diphosphate synthase
VSDPRLGLAEVVLPVSSGLERMRGAIAAQLAEHSGAVRDMTAHVGHFRGKQLRAALLLLSGEVTGNTTDEHPLVAAVVELIHLATLVHDDILDGAEVRRRVACVNQRWDNQTAVLLGDFLYARAFALSTELSSRLASRLLAETTRRICVGEIEQAAGRYDFDLSRERYEEIAGAKTASLYAAAAELGARYPGGNEATGKEMRAFGWALGLAFQIVDDCLDLVASEDELGKSAGTDVQDGKITLPVIEAYQRAGAATRAAIRDAFTRPDVADRRARLRSVCDLDAGVARAMERAHELLAGARERLAALPDSRSLTALLALVDFVAERRA